MTAEVEQKPVVFIGSSAENHKIAWELQKHLRHKCDTTVWTDGVFSPNSRPIEDLIKQTRESDFAIMVADADDTVNLRGQKKEVVRDNIIFELGLFIGALGIDRCFLVYDEAKKPNLPSDLKGIEPITYRMHKSGKLSASLGTARTDILQAIDKVNEKEKINYNTRDNININSDNKLTCLSEKNSIKKEQYLFTETNEDSYKNNNDVSVDMCEEFEILRGKVVDWNKSLGKVLSKAIWHFVSNPNVLTSYDSNNPYRIPDPRFGDKREYSEIMENVSLERLEIDEEKGVVYITEDILLTSEDLREGYEAIEKLYRFLEKNKKLEELKIWVKNTYRVSVVPSNYAVWCKMTEM